MFSGSIPQGKCPQEYYVLEAIQIYRRTDKKEADCISGSLCRTRDKIEIHLGQRYGVNSLVRLRFPLMGL